MKKRFFLSLLCVALFTTLVGCVDQIEIPNPNYDAETKQVTTQFVFNLSRHNPATKQNGEASQATENNAFLGVYNAYLLTNSWAGGDQRIGTILVRDTTMDKISSFTRAITPADLVGSSRRIFEMSLPLKTSVALFYGKAPEGTIPATITDYTAYDYWGHLDAFSITEVAGSTNFALGRRLASADVDKLTYMETTLSAILTTLMATRLDPVSSSHPTDNITSTSGTFKFDGNTYTFEASQTITGAFGYPKFFWSDFTKKNSAGRRISPLDGTSVQTELEGKLANLYEKMMTVKSDELRAGSGEAICRTINDLWTIINEVRCANPTSYQEALAVLFAKRVDLRLKDYFTAESIPSDGTPVTGVTFLTNGTSSITSKLSEDLANVSSSTYYTDGDPIYKYWPKKGESVKPDISNLSEINDMLLGEFPFNFNLPRGATHMKIWNRDATSELAEAKEVFYYPTSFDTSDMGGDPGEGTAYNANSYFYPSELLYFANSPLRVSDAEHTSATTGDNAYPGTASKPWNEADSWTGWQSGSDGFVKASTRSVALQYEINYGTALLETKVQYDPNLPKDTDNARYLEDNNHHVQVEMNPSLGDNDEPNKKIKIGANSFKLTGLIIGGQYITLDWDMLPKNFNANNIGFIYDKFVPDTSQVIPVTGKSKSNWTLVFDNCKGSRPTSGNNAGLFIPEATQSTVYIALEFQNKTGDDFYGNENMIRKDGYFYLIGELKPTGNTTTITWPTNHVVPPYTLDGHSTETRRVFIQDFVTHATFTLGRYSLQYAYLTVPDLRTSSLSLGVSVDTEWSSGLEFTTILGGDHQYGTN